MLPLLPPLHRLPLFGGARRWGDTEWRGCRAHRGGPHAHVHPQATFLQAPVESKDRATREADRQGGWLATYAAGESPTIVTQPFIAAKEKTTSLHQRPPHPSDRSLFPGRPRRTHFSPPSSSLSSNSPSSFLLALPPAAPLRLCSPARRTSPPLLSSPPHLSAFALRLARPRPRIVSSRHPVSYGQQRPCLRHSLPVFVVPMPDYDAESPAASTPILAPMQLTPSLKVVLVHDDSARGRRGRVFERSFRIDHRRVASRAVGRDCPSPHQG